MSGPAILVTGAAGFVGRNLVRRLAQTEHAVVAVDIEPHTTELLPDVEYLLADSADPDLLKRVRRGDLTHVVHQAAITDTMEPSWTRLLRENVHKAIQLATACSHGGTRFIYASSASVYGAVRSRAPVAEGDAQDRGKCSGPLSLYGRSKLALETELGKRAGSLSSIGLRYTNVFGRHEEHKGRMACILTQMLRRTATTGRIQIFNDSLTAARDYIPVDDVVETILNLVRSSGVPDGVYNLGSGVPVSFATVLEWCGRLRRDEAIHVELIPNPVKGQYQYWTCADTSALARALPGAPTLTVDDIYRAAESLFRSFHRPEAAEATVTAA